MAVLAAIGVALGATAGTTAAVVVGGAVVGAVAGGVIAAATGGDILKGALVGGLVGATAGLVGGATGAMGATNAVAIGDTATTTGMHGTAAKAYGTAQAGGYSMVLPEGAAVVKTVGPVGGGVEAGAGGLTANQTMAVTGLGEMADTYMDGQKTEAEADANAKLAREARESKRATGADLFGLGLLGRDDVTFEKVSEGTKARTNDEIISASMEEYKNINSQTVRRATRQIPGQQPPVQPPVPGLINQTMVG